MTQETELRPCPLCGGVAEWEYTEWDEETETGDDGTGYIKCQNCRLELFGHDREDTEHQWNDRVQAEEAARYRKLRKEILRCRELHGYFEYPKTEKDVDNEVDGY
jgi:hypothetical protein